jgi:hypothetical protein
MQLRRKKQVITLIHVLNQTFITIINIPTKINFTIIKIIINILYNHHAATTRYNSRNVFGWLLYLILVISMSRLAVTHCCYKTTALEKYFQILTIQQSVELFINTQHLLLLLCAAKCPANRIRLARHSHCAQNSLSCTFSDINNFLLPILSPLCE